ncbi:MAG: hypothetical protein V9E96_04595 [Chitinophagaceae bacterium]
MQQLICLEHKQHQNQLELQVNYNGGYADLLYVRNNATASTTKEATDGSKLSNPDVNVYAIASGKRPINLRQSSNSSQYNYTSRLYFNYSKQL